MALFLAQYCQIIMWYSFCLKLKAFISDLEAIMNKNQHHFSKKQRGWLWFLMIVTAEILWILGNYLALQA